MYTCRYTCMHACIRTHEPSPAQLPVNTQAIKLLQQHTHVQPAYLCRIQQHSCIVAAIYSSIPIQQHPYIAAAIYSSHISRTHVQAAHPKTRHTETDPT